VSAGRGVRVGGQEEGSGQGARGSWEGTSGICCWWRCLDCQERALWIACRLTRKRCQVLQHVHVLLRGIRVVVICCRGMNTVLLWQGGSCGEKQLLVSCLGWFRHLCVWEGPPVHA
jgi:hypothetical protein